MKVETDFAGRQDLGSRAAQEDSYGFAILQGTDSEAQCLLAVVADGMGGHAGGSLASQKAVAAFADALHEVSGDKSTGLQVALDASNAAVAQVVETGGGELDGAGTTLVAAIIRPDRIEWISAGDSPLLLVRDGAVQRLNEDHSMRPVLLEQVVQGALKIADLSTHPDRNVLLSALRGYDIEKVDSNQPAFDLRDGDWILIASDGLLTLEEDEIAKTVSDHQDAKACILSEALLSAVTAKQKPKQDNTTVAAVRIGSPAPSAQEGDDQAEKPDNTTRVIVRTESSTRNDDQSKTVSHSRWVPAAFLSSLRLYWWGWIGLTAGSIAIGLWQIRFFEFADVATFTLGSLCGIVCVLIGLWVAFFLHEFRILRRLVEVHEWLLVSSVVAAACATLLWVAARLAVT